MWGLLSSYCEIYIEGNVWNNFVWVWNEIYRVPNLIWLHEQCWKKHKLRLSQIQHDLQRFKYHWLHCSCIAEPPFCLTWCPTNIMLRSAVGIIRRHNKNGKYRCINYDKESYVYFNRWSISVGLVAWINWESTIMFFWLHFKPTGKTPLPFRNLLPSDPTTPQNVPDTLWGEGVWIF